MTSIRLFRVIVPVSDIDQAADFYAKILLQRGKRVSSGRHYFQCGQTILACFSPRQDGDDWDATPNPDHIYFSVDELEAARQRCIDAGAHDVGAIAVRPWGERSFYASDSDGNKFCMVDGTTLFGVEPTD